MFALEYSWLATHLRLAGERMRYLRRAAAVVLLVGACLAFARFTTTRCFTELACVSPANAAPQVDAAAHNEWPRTVLRLWLLLPGLAVR